MHSHSAISHAPMRAYSWTPRTGVVSIRGLPAATETSCRESTTMATSWATAGDAAGTPKGSIKGGGPMNAKRISTGAFGTLLIALGVACADSPTATPAAVATTLSATSATNIVGVVGSLVTERPSVIVRDQNGAPMPGVRVLFSLIAGGGSISQGSVESDALGRATLKI